MDTLTWEEPLTQRMKVERNLNFSTIANEEDEFGFSRKKSARDPMSHRIIEKRRRDRMNNCLADLSRLVPTNYLKKGRGRIEKTEIIEMAIKHLKHLQAHPCKDPASCEVAKATEQDHKRQYRLGYHEAMSETVRFMVESEGIFSGDGICVRLINHLQKHYDKVAGGMCYTQALGMMAADDAKSSIHMEVDSQSNSCFPSDTCSNGGLTHGESNSNNPVSFSYESRGGTEVSELKQEVESNGHLPPPPPTAPVKVTSQLREMLQNPGLPKDPARNGSSSAANGAVRSAVNGHLISSPPPSMMPVLVVVQPNGHSDHPTKEETCYKFKNNIKHRFNNDLRHHTSSPTDSHASDKMSLPDDDHNNNNSSKIAEPYPIRPVCHPLSGTEDRLGHATAHAFTPYQPGSHPAPELATAKELHGHHNDPVPPYGAQHWDSHAETASSCGSSSSPPPHAPRSNGSSSGYSTNGENNPGPPLLVKSGEPPHSPALSPYSRTPDRLSNRSPSPLHPHPAAGVPIFALHPKGAFYIPLTVDASLLVPYLVGIDDLAPVLHPISISVNLGFHSVKVEKVNGSAYGGSRHPQHSSSYLMDKFQDRYVYPDKSLFYPQSPPRNVCS